MDLAGLEPTAAALCLHTVLPQTELQAQSPAGQRWPAGIQLRPDRRQLVRASDVDPIHPNKLHLPREKKKRARIGAQQIESNESSPCLRNSENVNNVGASVPPLRAGIYQMEMEARVDCGYADPPCVSALLCRCSGTRWWMKESNLRVSPGAHQNRGCAWSRLWGALFAPRQRWNVVAGYRRRAWLRFADRDSYAIGLASGASLVPR